MRFRSLLSCALAGVLSDRAHAQPAPPIPPLQAPVAPAENPVTEAKTLLGKALFWDEQMSSTRTTACATCHIPSAGGSDPRSFLAPEGSTHPGADGVLGTGDDVVGSPGVPRTLATGAYEPSDHFGIGVQNTGRKTPSMVNAAYAPELFWDGRAGGRFVDPVAETVVAALNAALESQAAGPPLSDEEMSHAGRDWNGVSDRIAGSTPLALASDLPVDLGLFVEGRTYNELFAEAFGSPGVTPSRIIMAIATYQRALFSDQTPFNEILRGQQPLTAQEARGRAVFGASGCLGCHGGNRLTDDQYHFIGLRPAAEDLGRFAVTGLPGDRGAFRTPSLLNVELRAPYFHNGQAETLSDVVEFYDRGGDFDAPNKAPAVQPLNLTDQEKADLVAFLSRPLTDPRVAEEQSPFDRPTLYTESGRAPTVHGDASDASVGCAAVEPPLIGSDGFTCAISAPASMAGLPATLAIGYERPSPDRPDDNAVFIGAGTLAAGVEQSYASQSWAIPRAPGLVGATVFARWYVETGSGVVAGPTIEFTPFGDADCVADLNSTNANPGDTAWALPDGAVNGSDLSYFVESWLGLDAGAADLNTKNQNPGDAGYGRADGEVDGSDLSFYVEAWLAGCP